MAGDDWKRVRASLPEREVREALEARSRLPADSPIHTEISVDEFIVLYAIPLRGGREHSAAATPAIAAKYNQRDLWFALGAGGAAILAYLAHLHIALSIALAAVAAFFAIRIVVTMNEIKTGKVGANIDSQLQAGVIATIAATAEDRRRIRQLGGG